MFEKFNKLCRLTLNNWTLDQDTMETICKKSTLVYLNLKSCRVPSHGILSIGNLVNLEYLNIESIGNIDTRIFIKNISKLEKLETLIMNKVYNADSIDQIVYCLNKLKVFECAECVHSVTDIGIMRVLRNCYELKTLSVSSTDISENSLTCAIDVAKIRKNNVVLKMLVSYDVFDEFRDTVEVANSRLYESPFLRIEVTDRDDDDDEDEDTESQESDHYEFDMSDDENNHDYFIRRYNYVTVHLRGFYDNNNNQNNPRGWHVVENRNGNGNENVNVRRLDKDGNLVDGFGRRVDNQGNLLDDGGNRIDGYADFIGDDEW